MAFGYSHIVEAPNSDLVIIAGQYGSDPTGAVESAGFAAQVERSFANLGTALAAAGLGFRDVPASAPTSWITTTRSSKPSSR